MTEKFIGYALEAGLLEIGNSFHTTEKGLQFLQAYQTLELLLNTNI
jgi:predicted transcriptional regulator